MKLSSVHPDIFAINEFINPKVCAELISELDQGTAFPAGVAKAASRIDVDMRRANRVEVSEQTLKQVNELLGKLQIPLAESFQISLTGFERPQFLVYKGGDFYRKHVDNSTRPDAPDYIKARRVSIVIFLNSQISSPGTTGYAGGSLIIHAGGRVSIRGETGKLIAFPSHLPHEVEAVGSGQRYSIVDWFF